MTTRKRIDIKLPRGLLKEIDSIAEREEKTRTRIIEDALRDKYQIKIKEKPLIHGVDWILE